MCGLVGHNISCLEREYLWKYLCIKVWLMEHWSNSSTLLENMYSQLINTVKKYVKPTHQHCQKICTANSSTLLENMYCQCQLINFCQKICTANSSTLLENMYSQLIYTVGKYLLTVPTHQNCQKICTASANSSTLLENMYSQLINIVRKYVRPVPSRQLL